MKLVFPNPGECADRQAILHCKAEAALTTLKDPNPLKTDPNDTTKFEKKVRLDPKPFTDEINRIQAYLDSEFFLLLPLAKGETYNALFQRLIEANKQLYKVNNDVRKEIEHHPKGNDTDLTFFALRLVELNDARANLVKEINQLFGISTVEKLYEFGI